MLLISVYLWCDCAWRSAALSSQALSASLPVLQDLFFLALMSPSDPYELHCSDHAPLECHYHTWGQLGPQVTSTGTPRLPALRLPLGTGTRMMEATLPRELSRCWDVPPGRLNQTDPPAHPHPHSHPPGALPGSHTLLLQGKGPHTSTYTQPCCSLTIVTDARGESHFWKAADKLLSAFSPLLQLATKPYFPVLITLVDGI